MNKWSPERAEAIRQFIDEYFMENRKSPTVRDIAAGTGISKTSVQRYLTDMKEHGEIEYNGRRSIGTNLSRNMFETTPAIRYDSTVSCGLPSEPNVEEALDLIIPKYVTSIFYGALVEALASENGARMQAMDSATSNAEDMISDLSLKYNRARQGSMTQELTEIIAGAEAIS